MRCIKISKERGVLCVVFASATHKPIIKIINEPKAVTCCVDQN